MSYAIVVHGGAGPKADQEQGEAARAGCLAAAELGAAVLARGGSALDAVEQAARALEDDPLFNAGFGAVLNADGEVELDASVMNGETLQAGAVAVVKTVKNPVSLARLVMEKKSTEITEENRFKKRDKVARFVIGKGYEPELVWEYVKDLLPD